MAALRLPVLRDPPIDHDDVGTWVESLGEATWIVLSGADDRRCRVITTLLHGNEPSGVLALHRWLAERPRPRTRLAVLVANVEAALTPPHFTHRSVPGGRDLNRCFRPPHEGAGGALARAIVEDLQAWAPECVIDLHNTSGNGPSFAVATQRDPWLERLAGQFCERLIVTDFRLGSLMELPLVVPGLAGCPMLTLECGGALQPEARTVAGSVYRRLAEWPELGELVPNPDLDILVHPLRVELGPGVSIAYGREPEPGVDVTLWARIDEHNRGLTLPDTFLGWLGEGGLAGLQARDAQGRDRLPELLCERQGRLYPRGPMRLFMATTNVEIARSDCLFYIVPL